MLGESQLSEALDEPDAVVQSGFLIGSDASDDPKVHFLGTIW